MEGLLIAGDAIFSIGLIFFLIIFAVKLFFVIIKKEFEIFLFLIKIGIGVIVGGGLLLFIGRLFL